MRVLSLIQVVLLTLIYLSLRVDSVNIFKKFFGYGGTTGNETSTTTTTLSTGQVISNTTTPLPKLITETKGQGQTQAQPVLMTSSSSGSCWWTDCKSRCPGASTVMSANRCETNGFKFNCCSG